MGLTKRQAVALYESNWWEGLPAHDIVLFQLFEDRLCLPFDKFQAAMEKALGRPVWTHEFAYRDSLIKEFLGEKPAPTFAEILALIPEDKRVLVLA